MAKLVKHKWMGARVDSEQETRINAYVEASDEITQGELFRRGADEYMANHPIKNPKTKVDSTKVRKPGE